MHSLVTRWFECAACTFPVMLLHQLNGVDEALDCGNDAYHDDDDESAISTIINACSQTYDSAQATIAKKATSGWNQHFV